MRNFQRIFTIILITVYVIVYLSLPVLTLFGGVSGFDIAFRVSPQITFDRVLWILPIVGIMILLFVVLKNNTERTRRLYGAIISVILMVVPYIRIYQISSPVDQEVSTLLNFTIFDNGFYLGLVIIGLIVMICVIPLIIFKK